MKERGKYKESRARSRESLNDIIIRLTMKDILGHCCHGNYNTITTLIYTWQSIVLRIMNV